MTVPKEERHKKYLPLIAQGMGYRKIAKLTGLPLNTVKSDLRELNPKPKGGLSTPPHPPNNPPADMDWKKAGNRVGQIQMQFVERCLKANKTDELRAWITSFASMLKAMTGQSLIAIQVNTVQDIPPNLIEQIEDRAYDRILDLIEDCPVCMAKVREAARIELEHKDGATSL